MAIDLHNYEAFYLDFLEGRISKKEEAELFAFLERHPQYKVDVQDMAMATLKPEPVRFDDASGLKKLDFDQPVSEANFSDFCIAFYEGLLTGPKITELKQKSRASSELSSCFDEYARVKLSPNISVVYPGKKDLKKHRIIPLQWFGYGVAASIVLIICVPLLMKQRPVVSLPVALLNNASDTFKVETLPVPEKVPSRAVKMSTSHHIPVRKIPASKADEQSLQQKANNSEHQTDERIALVERMPLHIASETDTPGLILLPDDSVSVIVDNRQENYAYLKKSKTKRLSFLGIVSKGVNGLGDISGLDIRMKTEEDSTGKITAYSISAWKLEYYNTMK